MTNIETKKVILNSESGYSKKCDSLLNQLINEKVLLFCALGKDCELWHDVIDAFYIGNGKEKDFCMIMTWHTDQTLKEVIEFTKDFDFEEIDNEKIEIIEV